MAESVGYPESILKEEGVVHGESGDARKFTGDPRAKHGEMSAESGPPIPTGQSTSRRDGASHTTLSETGKSGPAQRDWDG